MLYCSERKQSLSGWLQKNHTAEFYSSLKLQKFLFFYEVLSKIENDTSELRTLKGYQNGPVFSDVYGDYTHRNDEFCIVSNIIYSSKPNHVDVERATFSGFLVSILNENDLSALTHSLDIWSIKEDDIMKGTRNVPLRSNDLSERDVDLILSLKEMYPSEYIRSVDVIKEYGKSFIVKKDEFNSFTEEHISTLSDLALQEELENPVYISLSSDGVILVD